MQSIVSNGKDVHDAINLGLDTLNVSKEEVNIEIIQQESKGFFGIGAKKAIVKLTKNQPAALSSLQIEELVEDALSNSHEKAEVTNSNKENSFFQKNVGQMNMGEELGKAWVKDGKLFCKSSPIEFPMVTIPRGVQLYKNNRLVNEKTIILSENDSYEIKLKNEEKRTVWNVKIDEQKLAVQLYIEPGYRLIRQVPDIAPEHHIELRVVEMKEFHSTVSYAEIMSKLESLKVNFGVNHTEILRAIESKKTGVFEIASGIKPSPGKDGWVEIKVEIDTQKGPKEKKNGNVEFREIQTIPTVEKGKILGVIHPPLPGNIGYTVMNEPLPSKKTYPIVLKIGHGVTLVEDKLVALESGRPKIEQRGRLFKVTILPKLYHQGDVDLSSGNIRFTGDVEIAGEVTEKMVVEAAGDLVVHKTTSMGTLIASGSIITYSNIVSSEVSAGKNSMLISELGHLLGILQQNVEKMISLITQLIHSPAFKSNDFSQSGLRPLLSILLEKRFKHFPSQARKYVEVVRRGVDYLDDATWRDIANSLTGIFLSLSDEIITLKRLLQLSEKMKEQYEYSKTPIEPNSFITIPSALNSRMYCSGNILILEKGCINTKIHAGGSLKISGTVRGGSAYGRLGADINEAGSESGARTLIAVPSDQSISINKVMEGTTIQIGNVKHTFHQTSMNIKARLDEYQRIVFE
jgi:uncharacterized protein